MTYNPEIHHRRSIRLQGYDYSQNGAYFVTICLQDRIPLFGEVINGEMQLNPLGIIACEEWLKTAEMRNNIELDEFAIMPNHMHGIIVIDDLLSREQMYGHAAACPNVRAPMIERFGKPTSNTIPTIIRGFKSAVTNRINTAQICAGTYNMPEKIWQRNYYEHVMRNEASLNKIREYIQSNPLNWNEDDYFLP